MITDNFEGSIWKNVLQTYQYQEVCGDEQLEGVCPVRRIVPQSHPNRGPTQRHHQTSAPSGTAPMGAKINRNWCNYPGYSVNVLKI